MTKVPEKYIKLSHMKQTNKSQKTKKQKKNLKTPKDAQVNDIPINFEVKTNKKSFYTFTIFVINHRANTLVSSN